MRGILEFFRHNPQALVLLIICLVLGLGTFIAIVIAVAGSGGGSPAGEPSGVVTFGYLTPWMT